ncbi:hypothetical protein D2E65_09325 [Mycobacteroides abscessus]|nr:hypothetical protein D2E65_09325 [Mycobacteroides abscessus]
MDNLVEERVDTPMTESKVAPRTRAAHDAAIKTDTAQIAQFLSSNLGPTLTAYIAGVDKRTIARYVNGDKPREDSETRLRAAYQIFNLINEVEANHTVRAWFMGMNPQLDDESPAESLAAGDFRGTMAAARAFVAGG